MTNDLRKAFKEVRKTSYKTKLCKQFFNEGYCPYGARCQFSHKNVNISYINILEQIIKSKKLKFEITPRLNVFKNFTKDKK